MKRRRTIRIAGGSLKGRSLRYPDGGQIRPTTQRSKSSFFETLGPRIEGAVFVDFFAGAGAVGLEAISRGAARVHFVEKSPAAVGALRSNLDDCGVEDRRWVVHDEAVASTLSSLPGAMSLATVIFADPPYDFDSGGGFLLALPVEKLKRLQIVAIEHRKDRVLTPPPGLVLTRVRRLGDTVITYFTPRSATGVRSPES